ncbi:MAG: lysoplasmalogenase [Flavobacteriales bacterium]|nr:lysoplasmalogenase [Flavobacteriales bacterium]
MELARDPRANGVVYAALVFGALLAELNGWRTLTYLLRPAMLIHLSVWFYFSSRRYGNRFTLLVQAGLFFSLLGDIALMFQHKDPFNFILGLAAMLLACICYTIAFAQNVAEVGDLEGLWISVLIGVIFLAFGFFFVFDLVRYLDDFLMVPVIAFMVGPILLGAAAGARFKRTYPLSFWSTMIGACCLMAFASLLAWTRFVRPFERADLLILFLYAAGQFLIAFGSLVHVLDPDQIRRRKALAA